MLRDRFDIIDTQFKAREQVVSLNAQQPYGGVFSRSFSYTVAAVRVDNFSNRWIYFDSEGFVIPPFTHGFVINLFTRQQGVTFKSVKSPFGPLATGYTADFNPKKVTSPFPTSVLVSLYDDPQPQLAPQSLVRIDNALMQPLLGMTAAQGASDINPGPILGLAAGFGYPVNGSLILPTFSISGFYEQSNSGKATVGDRNVSQSVGGKLAVAAGVATSVVDADQPQAFQGSLLFQRLFRAIVSVSVAGDLDLIDSFSAVSGSRGSFATVTLPANIPFNMEFGHPGYLISDGNTPPGINVFQFKHSVAATITYTLEWAVK